MLNEIGIPIRKTITINRWLEYTKIMRELAVENDVTPRELDMALFAMHKEKLDKQNFSNLYK